MDVEVFIVDDVQQLLSARERIVPGPPGQLAVREKVEMLQRDRAKPGQVLTIIIELTAHMQL
jgi:hypothetical protein